MADTVGDDDPQMLQDCVGHIEVFLDIVPMFRRREQVSGIADGAPPPATEHSGVADFAPSFSPVLGERVRQGPRLLFLVVHFRGSSVLDRLSSG